MCMIEQVVAGAAITAGPVAVAVCRCRMATWMDRVRRFFGR